MAAKVQNLHFEPIFRPNTGCKDSFAISFNLARVQLGLFVVVYPYEKDVAGVFGDFRGIGLALNLVDGGVQKRLHLRKQVSP